MTERMTSPPPSALDAVLLIEEHDARRSQCAAVLAALEKEVHQAVSGDDWESGLIEGTFLAAVLGDCDRPRVVEFLRRRDPHLPVLLLTETDAASPVGPWTQQVLGTVEWPLRYPNVERALERAAASRQHFGGERPADLFRGLVGRSAAINQVRQLIRQVAGTDATVLVLGESGTGKEMVARNIHYLSTRRGGPFVPLNCGAIPAELLESELFGHEKGAFTGAQTAQAGKFEQAQGGTLLLDEISEMPLGLQAKLLRVLQEREVERVGGKKPTPIDIRVLATSNREMAAEVRGGRFREDLFYRLNVFPLEIPPLRARPGDILPLARQVLARLAAERRRPASFAADAEAQLLAYAWPGNVRELENCIQRALILEAGEIVTANSLLLADAGAAAMAHDAAAATAAPVTAMPSAFEVTSPFAAVPSAPTFPASGMSAASETSPAATPADMKSLERQHILDTLARVGHSRKKAVAMLGISERTLRYKLRQYRAEGFLVDEEGA